MKVEHTYFDPDCSCDECVNLRRLNLKLEQKHAAYVMRAESEYGPDWKAIIEARAEKGFVVNGTKLEPGMIFNFDHNTWTITKVQHDMCTVWCEHGCWEGQLTIDGILMPVAYPDNARKVDFSEIQIVKKTTDACSWGMLCTSSDDDIPF